MKKAVKLVNGDEQETGTYSLGDGLCGDRTMELRWSQLYPF